MKKLIMIILSLVWVQAAAFAENYKVNLEASEVKWTAEKVGGKHFGRIHISSGEIRFEGESFVGGEASIATGSIVVDDLKNEKGNKKLVNHLKSPDFFDVEKYSSATIKITEVKPAGISQYDVTADITIKNITQSVKFPAMVEKMADGVRASAKITLDRTLYDIRYGSGKFFENLGDHMIHDDFILEVSVKAA